MPTPAMSHLPRILRTGVNSESVDIASVHDML